MRTPSRSSVFKYKGRIVEPKLRNQSREKGTGNVEAFPKPTNCNRSFLSADHKRCSRGAARMPRTVSPTGVSGQTHN